MRRVHLRGRDNILQRAGGALGGGQSRVADAQTMISTDYPTPFVGVKDDSREIRRLDVARQHGSNAFRRGAKTASFTSRCWAAALLIRG
jgi:hypothetical protein